MSIRLGCFLQDGFERFEWIAIELFGQPAAERDDFVAELRKAGFFVCVFSLTLLPLGLDDVSKVRIADGHADCKLIVRPSSLMRRNCGCLVELFFDSRDFLSRDFGVNAVD